MLSNQDLDAAREDAEARNVDAGEDKLPHASGPMIALTAQAGLGVVAGQDVQFANGETVSVMSGADSQFATGGQLRVHSGQAIGVLAGAVQPGDDNVGLQLIAGKGAIDYQAQADEIKVQARDEINVISANAHIDWAAAKSISLSTAGGANITIAGGNITVQCPGKIMIHAGTKIFGGPAHTTFPLPRLPQSAIAKRALKFKLRLADTPGPNGHSLAHTPWIIAHGEKPDGLASIAEKRIALSGRTDADGQIQLTPTQDEKLAEIYCQNPDRTWLVYPGHSVRLSVAIESAEWGEKEKLLHAMNAADFSPELHSTLFEEGASSRVRYAKEALGVNSTRDVFPKVKS